MTADTGAIFDPSLIASLLEQTHKEKVGLVADITEKALELKGLKLAEAAILLKAEDEENNKRILEAASRVKSEIYGSRLVLFAPLYISSLCVNDCAYCGFKSSNHRTKRRLSTGEIREETAALIDMGHRRLLLECGEHDDNAIDYVTEAISAIYSTTTANGNIRRINVNIAATGTDDYRKLKEADIGTYQLFQETYNRAAYKKLHSGPKADYTRQLLAMDRAYEAGIEDVGLGVLYGLYDFRFDTLAMLSHAGYLESRYGVGPHTLSVPRLKPAPGVKLGRSHFKVSDFDLLRVIAVLRLTLPYTGIILSTRESASFRSRAFSAGVSQASTASITTPGGYSSNGEEACQFTTEDKRSMEEFLSDIIEKEIIPSFCTACYRRGRTGEAFMNLARPGEIEHFCTPNAILTFKEYIEEFARGGLKEAGEKRIEDLLSKINEDELRIETEKRARRIEAGERDLFF